jgi:general secretion pathway protein J
MSTLPPAARRRAAGFTLIEVLVALGMFALLMAMLTEGVRLVMKSYETGTQQTERLSQLTVVHDVLRDQLSNAGRNVPGRAEELGPVFIGAADHLEFVGSLPSHFAAGGLQVIFLGLSGKKAGERDLVVRWRPYEDAPIDRVEAPLRGRDRDGEDDATMLLDHVAKVEFAYFGSPDPDRDPAWFDEWRVQDYGPSLVRLRLLFDDGYTAPEFVAQLRVSPAP